MDQVSAEAEACGARRRARHRRGHARAARVAAGRRALGVRARGRRHHPGRIRPAASTSSASRSTPQLEAEDRASTCAASRASTAAGRCSTAAPSTCQRQRQGLFRAEDDRRSGRRAAHGAGARGDPGARRRARSNVFTRIMLALFGKVPWRAVPVMPVEIMLLPRWFPFHLDKISYWARTVIVPLLVLMALKPRARNPRGVGIDELFLEPPRRGAALAQGAAPDRRLGLRSSRPSIDVLRAVEPLLSEGDARQRAIDQAVALRRRAAQRRGRARRHLPGHGQHA